MTAAVQTGDMLFNGLDIIMSAPDPTYGYRIRVMDGDTDFGNGEAVISDIQSQLQDGDLQRVDRYGNRTAVLDLRIDAPGAPDTPGAAVAAGQRAVELAAGFTGWAELRWTSPMAGADTSVMEMTSAVVGKTLNTAREMSDGTRIIKVTIGARPFVRPTVKDTFAAPTTVGSTTTSVDSGSATTGWSLLSTAPSPVHNLSPNPSFETNTTGWAAGAGTSSITRSTGGGYVGTAFLSVAESATSGRAYANSPASVVTAGSSYWVHVAPKGNIDNATTGGGCLVRFYSDTSATVQVGTDWTTTFSTASGWTPKTFNTPAAPATAIRMRIFPFVNSTASFVGGGSTWFLDAAAPFDSAIAGYGDGATTATAALTWAWDGTAGLSTSTGTWTAPALAVVSGAVQGTVYGRSSASIRRNNTGITGAAMATLPYIRIRGTASAYTDGQVTIADNGGGAITPTTYNYNSTTGAFDIIINRPGGFTNLDVTFTRTTGVVSTTTGLAVAVDQIDITDNPFASGKVQTRQITIGGSQRTELSLSVLGLDAAGTTPVALGEQVLVHTAAAGTDSRAKFLSARTASGLGGTADATATGGVYTALPIVSGTPTAFTFPVSALLPGNCLLVARLKPTTTGTKTIYFRGFVDPTTGDNAYDPPGGLTWKSTPLGSVASGATWPTFNQNAYGMLPLGLLRLPPADVQDPGATLTIQIAADTAGVVNLDDLFICNVDVGQVSLIRTDISGGSFSAVQLNGATVDTPYATAWVGVANGTMMTDPTRLLAFAQHQATPGLLQVSSVTPTCATSRLSGSYYRRYGNDVAPAV